MIAPTAPGPTAPATTTAQTIQVITPTALRCACEEYRVNRFCIHLVYFTVAKILAHRKGYAQ